MRERRTSRDRRRVSDSAATVVTGAGIVGLPLLLGILCCTPGRSGEERESAARVGGDAPARVDIALGDGERHDHSERPTIPNPQRPEPSTPETRDTGRPFLDWQHVTGDWRGVRPWLDDRGIVFDSSWTLDVSRSLRGGIDTERTIARHLFDLNVTLDTERLWGWSGGTLFVDFQSFDGETGDLLVGDYQVFSNIDTLPVTQFPQLWVEQRLFEEALRIKLGLVDANGEFAYTDHGAAFLNSSMGFSPTIFVMPTYPDPATSLNVFWEPSETFHAGVGVYDGAGQRGVPTGSRGPRSLLDEDLFTIGEVAVRWGNERVPPGRVAVGGWHHDGEFATHAGGLRSGTAGWYAVLDQWLLRECDCDDADDQGIGMFLQYGAADPEVSEVREHFGAGFTWRGAIPRRDDDTFGLGVSLVRFGDVPGPVVSPETATEAFYEFRLTKWAAVVLDLQYITHPGGVPGRRDTLVGTSRFVLQF